MLLTLDMAKCIRRILFDYGKPYDEYNGSVTYFDTADKVLLNEQPVYNPLFIFSEKLLGPYRRCIRSI